MIYAVYAFVALASSVEPAQQSRFALVARAYVEADADAVLAPAAMPPNVVVADSYLPTVRDMLERSGTFRQQCRRIGSTARLAVRLRRWFPQERPTDNAANTVMVRRRDGVIEATILVGEAGDPVELIAHEFEHILEQLDDVDLAAMGSRPGAGVYVNPSTSRFETDRAIAAGRRVAAEVTHARR